MPFAQRAKYPISHLHYYRRIVLQVVFFILLGIVWSICVPKSQAGAAIPSDVADANVGFERWSGSPILYDFDYSGDFFVGRRYNNEVMSMVVPFALPYLPPGHQVTSATIEFYLEEKVGDASMENMNVALYGLNRTTSAAQVSPSDHYSGTDDNANSLLTPTFATQQSPAGTKIQYSGPALVEFLNQRYAAAGSAGDLARKFVYFRLSPALIPNFGTRYVFTSTDYYEPDFRSRIPLLRITTSGPTPSPRIDRLQFSFQSDRTRTTSAGVFTPDGKLIRTLWNNRIFDAGTNYEVWDGTDDAGATAPAGTYELRVLQHNVSYVWEGVVGNTSRNKEGYIHRSFLPISGMSIAGGKAYFATSYNERQVAMRFFNLSDPQSPGDVLPEDPFSVVRYVATDGVRTYWVKIGEGFSGTGTRYSGIFATKNADNSFHIFQDGTSLSTSTQRYPSVIDYDVTDGLPHAPRGIAVQKDGRYLIASHPSLGCLRIYDKATGGLVSQPAVDSPSAVAVGPGGILWVICKDAGQPCVRRYQLQGNGTIQALRQTSDVVQPVALDVAPDGSYIVVADSGASQQLKAFSDSTAQKLWTYGQAGGNRVLGPEITNDRFEFTDDTFIAFQPDGAFWAGDQGNLRYMLFSPERAMRDQIFYMKHHYIAASDPNDPTRVFAEFFEFKVDYSKPLEGTNGSWKLVKNWRHGLPENPQHAYTGGLLAGLINVVTLPHGRTYALVENLRNGRFSLFELPASGPARWTGQEFEPNTRIYSDGSMRWSSTEGNTIKFFQAPLSGVDGNGDPHWASPEVIASAPAGPNDPVNADSQWNRQTVGFTAGGVVTSFNNGKFHTGYHLGGIRLGSNEWLWRASPSTSPSYGGPFPDDGRFDIGNGIQYAGNIQVSFGRSVIYGYHGEFWKNTQASQWVHFYDNGLMIGRFGTEGTSVPIDKAVAGFAGNTFAPSVVTYAGKTYLYVNDESNHGGVLRWRIDGLDTISESRSVVSMGQVADVALPSSNLDVALISPAPNTTFLNNTEISLVASVAASGTSVSIVEFFDGPNKIGEDSTYPYALQWTPSESGTRTLTAKLTGANGNTATSKPVTIVVGNSAVPPPPTSVTLGEVTDDSITINWQQQGAIAVGSIISAAFRQGEASQYKMLPTDEAGAPPFAAMFFNNYDAWDRVYTSPLNNRGTVVSNLKFALNARGQGQGWSLNKWTGPFSGYKLFVESMVSMTNGVRADFVPFFSYDLVVYSLPDGIQFGPKSSFVRIMTGPYINTVAQNFDTEPANYSSVDVELGTNPTVTNRNTIIFRGLTSHWFNLNSPNLAGFQIVERSASEAATGFRVDRRMGEGPWETIATLPGDARSYTDTGLAPNEKYAYRLLALNGTLVSPQSSSITTQTALTLAQALELAQTAPSVAREGDFTFAALDFSTANNPAANLRYVVEVSSDLISWVSGDSATQILSTVPAGNYTRVRVRDKTSVPINGRRFIRLKVVDSD